MSRRCVSEKDSVMADVAYGLWPLAIPNTELFAFFAVSFFHPRAKGGLARDGRVHGVPGGTWPAMSPSAAASG
jgi:hypothetical protein